MRIAIVEDDPIAAKLVSSALVKGFNKRGFTVDIIPFETGAQFISIASRDTLDVVILDWHLPDRTGIEILDWMKQYLKKLPTVIMVTQRQHDKDIIEALNEGADDFISKPFSPSVLSARVYAAYRRQLFTSLREAKQTELDFGNIILDEKNEVAYVNSEPVALTRQELKLAYVMLSRAGSILSRSYLYEYVWGMTHKAKTRTLDVHIHRLRKKLSLTGEYGWNLESVYGHGYRLERVGPLEKNTK